MSPTSVVQAADALQAIAMLGFLIWFLFGPWKRFVIDLVRQNLFEIRDEVFDYAARGNLDFDSEVYQLTRAKLNSMIRFCEGFSFLNLALVGDPKSDAEPVDRLRQLLREMPDQTTASWVQGRLFHAAMILTAAAVFRSAIGLVLCAVALPIVIAQLLLKGTRRQNSIVHKLVRRVERDVRIGDSAHA